MAVLLMDSEVYKLRHYAARSPDAKQLTVAQQVRLSMLDEWLHVIDAILEDRRLHRLNSHVLGHIWEADE